MRWRRAGPAEGWQASASAAARRWPWSWRGSHDAQRHHTHRGARRGADGARDRPGRRRQRVGRLALRHQAGGARGRAEQDPAGAEPGRGERNSEADQRDAILERLRPMSRLRDFDEVPLLIEAVPENPTLKCDLFRQLGLLCRPETVLASNTSSISITKLGAASGRPAQVLGLHFMNPVPVMRLVEVVQGMETSEETLALGVGVAKQMGKTPVVCKDSPGFIVNRVLIPMINEAIFLLQEGQDWTLTPPALDQAMTEGANHPMGPLALADMIGLDTVLSICEVLYQDLADTN